MGIETWKELDKVHNRFCKRIAQMELRRDSKRDKGTTYCVSQGTMGQELKHIKQHRWSHHSV